MTLNTYLIIYLIIFGFSSFSRMFLERLNSRYLSANGHVVPDVFQGEIDEGTLKKMRDYTVASSRVGSLEHLTGDLVIVVIILSGFIGWITNTILSLEMYYVLSGIVFFFAFGLIMGVLEIPFDLYSTFVIERRFAFSTISFRLWVADLLKSVFISAIILGVFLSVFLSLMLYARTTWWLFVWAFYIAFQLLVLWLYPVVIAPLFNKFEPIENQELVRGISNLMDSAGLKTEGIYRIDAARRSRHSNAYFTGLGKTKRIVLFDTLLENHSIDEIIAVLAHELGHWKLGHIVKQLLFAMGISFVLLYVASVLIEQPLLYSTFGVNETVGYVGLFILGLIFKPISLFFTPFGSMLSRRYEKQADDFAYHILGQVSFLIQALKRLAQDNLANLHPHTAFSWFFYSHPPLVERIERLEKLSLN